MTKPCDHSKKNLVFLDTEFTGTHAFTTLVSLGLTTLDEKEFYVSLNDYDKDQVSPWLKENVFNHIDESQSISKQEALPQLIDYLNSVRGEGEINLISAGKNQDIVLFFELWHALHPDRTYFHTSLLPDYLNHRRHFDLNTLLFAGEIDPKINRDTWIDHRIQGEAHHALHDARVVRECFLKLKQESRLPKVFREL